MPIPPIPPIKDSGRRVQLGGGMVRDVEDGKLDYSLIFDGPMLDRWAAHMTAGAEKYAPRNWMLAANGSFQEVKEAIQRARRSAIRHLRQWIRSDADEDHAAAVFFNLNMAEYLRSVLWDEAEDKQDPTNLEQV